MEQERRRLAHLAFILGGLDRAGEVAPAWIGRRVGVRAVTQPFRSLCLCIGPNADGRR